MKKTIQFLVSGLLFSAAANAAEIPVLEAEFFPVPNAEYKAEFAGYEHLLTTQVARCKSLQAQLAEDIKAFGPLADPAALKDIRKDLDQAYEGFRKAYALYKEATDTLTMDGDERTYDRLVKHFRSYLTKTIAVQEVAAVFLSNLESRLPSKPAKVVKKPRRPHRHVDEGIDPPQGPIVVDGF